MDWTLSSYNSSDVSFKSAIFLGGEINFLLGAAGGSAATLSEDVDDDVDVDATTVGTTKPVVADGTTATTATAARNVKLEKDVFIFFVYCLCLCFMFVFDVLWRL